MRKIPDFGVTAAIKQQHCLTNMPNTMMVCSCRYSCLELPVALVDCQVEVCPLRLNHICQGEYVLLNDIDFYRVERNIFRDCVDKILGQIKSETSKKVGDSIVYGTE